MLPGPPLDTPLLFAGAKGGHLNLHNWRRDEWKPALGAAGLDYRTPYSLRHTFVSECIAAGIATFEIARMAGTSVLQIEKTYGHLLPDAIERGRAALEAFDARSEKAFGQRRLTCPQTPKRRKGPVRRAFSASGRRDLNSGPLVPQTSALTRLRHAPLG